MRYRALAADYDGTLAQDGRVAAPTLDALRRWRDAGRRLVLVTGRGLEDLRRVLPVLDVFDLVVVENGGLLHRPDDGQVIPLAPAPHPALVSRLRRDGVTPLSVETVVLATTTSHEHTVQQALHDLRLGYHLERNRESLLVLPQGVDKASGLDVALRALSVAPTDTVGIGDAENDLSFLRLCGLSAAPADSLPQVQGAADLVTEGGAGQGVIELVDGVLSDDR